MPKAIVSTIPGSLDTKFIEIELGPSDACCNCGGYPTWGLHAVCDCCLQPVCGPCAVQRYDAHLCPTCAAKGANPFGH